MNKLSEQLSNHLQELEIKTAKLFNQLIYEHKEFNFLQALEDYEGSDEEILDELKLDGVMELLPMIECRNEINGNSHDFYILSVSENGIVGIDVEEYNEMIFKFDNLSSTHDRHMLLCEMEYLLENN